MKTMKRNCSEIWFSVFTLLEENEFIQDCSSSISIEKHPSMVYSKHLSVLRRQIISYNVPTNFPYYKAFSQCKMRPILRFDHNMSSITVPVNTLTFRQTSSRPWLRKNKPNFVFDMKTSSVFQFFNWLKFFLACLCRVNNF